MSGVMKSNSPITITYYDRQGRAPFRRDDSTYHPEYPYSRYTDENPRFCSGGSHRDSRVHSECFSLPPPPGPPSPPQACPELYNYRGNSPEVVPPRDYIYSGYGAPQSYLTPRRFRSRPPSPLIRGVVARRGDGRESPLFVRLPKRNDWGPRQIGW